MARKKLHRFEFNANAQNVIERGKDLYTTIKGKWREKYFKNDNPIVLELACGKGEYSVGLAKVFPNKNFIGIDIKGDRISRGSKNALDAGLSNVAFLRTPINYLEEFFDEDEVDEIWIIHPDPQPRDKEEKKRLTFPKFLELYKKILKNGGKLNLKTDNHPLYLYSIETLQKAGYQLVSHTEDLYNSELNEEHFGIETHYEKLFVSKGFKINYIKTTLIKS